MTFEEKFQQLHKEFHLKSDNHLKADLKLGGESNFFDKHIWDRFQQTKKELQEAAKKYYDFLDHFRNSGKSAHDEMG